MCMSQCTPDSAVWVPETSRSAVELASMQPAPESVKADVEKLLAWAQQGASTGDSASLTSPDRQTADRNIDQYMMRERGYQQIQITATEDVPNFVELRWRPGDHQAAVTASV